jgi:hypothetical protein
MDGMGGELFTLGVFVLMVLLSWLLHFLGAGRDDE